MNKTYDAPILSAITYYRRYITSALNGVTCSSYNDPIIISFNAVTSGAIAGNQTICSGGDPAGFTQSTASTGSGTLSYQWQNSLNNIDYTNISGVTTNTYDAPAGVVLQTTYFKRTAISTLNSVACSAVTSTPVTVTVNPISGGQVGSNQTICSGGNPVAFTQITASSGTGTLSYQWQSSPNSSSYTNIPSATATTYDVPAGLTQLTYYRRVTTATSGAVSCIAYSNNQIPMWVNVNPIPNVTNVNTVICSGQSPALTLTSDVTPATYSWSVLSKSSTITGTTVGATGITNPINHVLINSSTSAAGTVVYRITPTAYTCVGPYKDVTVTINSKLTGGTVGSDQIICVGGDPAAFTQTQASTGYGTLSYQWQSAYDLPFSNIAGATSTTYNVPSGQNQNLSYQRVTSSTQNSLTCKANSNLLTVSINAISVTIGYNETICAGGDPATIYDYGTSGLSVLTHQWKKSTNGVTFSNISGATSSVYNPPAGLNQTTYYHRVTTSSIAGCTGTSNTVTVTVNPLMAVITPASSTTFCEGQPVSVVLNANTGANLTHQWIKNGVNIPGATQSSYTATQVGLYQVIVTNTLAPCFITSLGVSVSVQTSGVILEDGNLCLDGYTILTTKPGSGHLWSTGSTSSTITVYDPGTFSVNYISVFGCPVFAEVTVVSVGSNCIFARMKKNLDPEVEVEEVEEIKTLGVYPNPANDEITAQFNKLAMFNLEVGLISQFGYLVGSSTIKKGENKTTIDTRNLANGVYIVVVKSARGFVVRQKVLVQHR